MTYRIRKARDWNSLAFSCYIEQLFFVRLCVLYHGFIETKNIQKASKKIKSNKKEGIKVFPPLLKGLKRAILAIKKSCSGSKNIWNNF